MPGRQTYRFTAPAQAPTLDQVVSVLEGALVEDVLPYHSAAWVSRAQAVVAAYKTSTGSLVDTSGMCDLHPAAETKGK